MGLKNCPGWKFLQKVAGFTSPIMKEKGELKMNRYLVKGAMLVVGLLVLGVVVEKKLNKNNKDEGIEPKEENLEVINAEYSTRKEESAGQA